MTLVKCKLAVYCLEKLENLRTPYVALNTDILVLSINICVNSEAVCKIQLSLQLKLTVLLTFAHQVGLKYLNL